MITIINKNNVDNKYYLNTTKIIGKVATKNINKNEMFSVDNLISNEIIFYYKDDANINVSIGNIENNSIFTIRAVDMFTLGPDGLVENYTIVNEASIIAIFTKVALKDVTIPATAQIKATDKTIASIKLVFFTIRTPIIKLNLIKY